MVLLLILHLFMIQFFSIMYISNGSNNTEFTIYTLKFSANIITNKKIGTSTFRTV